MAVHFAVISLAVPAAGLKIYFYCNTVTLSK